MKQRLLLALLVLFASVGTTWGADEHATITIPGGSPAVTITYSKTNVSGQTGTVTFRLSGAESDLTESSSSTVTINPSTSTQTVNVTLTNVASAGLTVNGQVSGVTLSSDKFTSLEVKNNNQKLESGLSISSAKLTSLTVNDCGLTSLPTNGFATDKAVTVNAKNNKITDISSVNITRGDNAKLTYELDGNQIIKIPSAAIANVTFNYGTQIVTFDLGDDAPIANKWFDVKKSLINHESNGIPALSSLDKAKATVTWTQNGSSVSPMNQNGWEYKFFSGNKFLQGAIVCKIVPNSDQKKPSYAIHFTVAPAKFKLKKSATTGGSLNVANLTHTSEVVDGEGYGTVCDGDILLFTAAAANGSSFSKYKLSDNSFTTTGVSNQYKVAVTKSDIDEVSVEAEFTQKTFAVTITKSGSGSYEVVDENNQPVNETSLSLPYNSTLYIKATPEAGFQALVSKNGEAINVISNSSDPFNGYYKVEVTVATTIKILFEASSADPQLIIPYNSKISQVKVNGTAYTPTASTPSKVDIKKGNTVIIEASVSGNNRVTQIMLDGVVKSTNSKAEFTMPDADATLTFTTVAATAIQIIPSDNTFTYDGTTKTFQFETVPAGITGFTVQYSTDKTNYSSDLPKGVGNYYVYIYRAADALYNVINSKYADQNSDQTPTIDESKLTMEIKQAEPKINSTPSVTVDPSTKAYKISGGSATPSGTWKVVDTSDNDAEISYCTQTESHVVTVMFTPSDNVNYTSVKRQVPVTIGTALTNYAISWYTVPAGMTFTVKNGNQVITSGTKVAKGTVLTLELTYPAGYTNVRVVEDNANYTPVLPNDTGSAGGSGDAGSAGGSGDAGSAGGSGDTGSAGGSGDTGSTGGSGDTGSTGGSGDTGSTGGSGDTGSTGGSGDTGSTGGSGDTGSTGGSGDEQVSSSVSLLRATTTLSADYTVDKEVKFKFEYQGGEVAKATPKIKLTAPTNAVTYDGSVKTVETSETSDAYYLSWVAPAGNNSSVQLKITYKQGSETVVSPVNAGKYTVCVHIPEFTGSDSKTYAATDVEFTDAFVIAKAKPAVSEWPETAMLGAGQPLSQARFIGGQVNVAGAFAFVDGTIVPEADKAYSVKFVPANTNNYEEVTTNNSGAPKTLKVTVSDKRIVALEAMVGGSVVVKDKATNKEYKSGDELPSSVKEIIITAVPNTGYKLETLKVNGSAFTSGSSYTLGTSSVTISATFEEIKEFTVSVSTSVKGIELVLPSSNVVKKGASYSFSVKGLAADLANLVVSDGTNIYTGTNGAYTISNITANKTITVTMKAGTAPTQVEAVIEANLSTQGKSMGTVTVTKISSLRADAVDSSTQKFYYGDKIRVTATPAAGCRFVGWEGRTETSSVIDVVITETSYKFKAVFAGSPTGAEVIEGVDIYGSNGEIVVKCDGAARITIVSMNGQSKQQEISGDTRIPAGAGIYGIVFEQGNNVMRTKVAVK